MSGTAEVLAELDRLEQLLAAVRAEVEAFAAADARRQFTVTGYLPGRHPEARGELSGLTLDDPPGAELAAAETRTFAGRFEQLHTAGAELLAAGRAALVDVARRLTRKATR